MNPAGLEIPLMVCSGGAGTMQFSEIVVQRRSTKKYDPSHVMTDGELKSLFERVILSPSSFNRGLRRERR